ncbi:MAG: nucleoside hydrolase [Chloroflexi bacterium]|nr:nucleoside hydrolase [Chloroflexota bacterium]
MELASVLTVAGNVGLELTTRNTLRVLDWLGASDVPVYMGADRPLRGDVREASYWHGIDGLGGAELPESLRTADPNGVDYLCRRVLQDPGQVTLVCTAPLTNLALALQREPRIVECVQKVVLMGGAVFGPGNVTPVAEFNIYADPSAAALVFEQPWPITMVGLDVTEHVRLMRDEQLRLAVGALPEAVLVREVTRHIFDMRGMPSMALHDPLALLIAVEPDLVTTVQHDVQVETRGEHTLGQTVVDLRQSAPPPRLDTWLCTEVDAARAKERFLQTLLDPVKAH